MDSKPCGNELKLRIHLIRQALIAIREELPELFFRKFCCRFLNGFQPPEIRFPFARRFFTSVCDDLCFRLLFRNAAIGQLFSLIEDDSIIVKIKGELAIGLGLFRLAPELALKNNR